MDQTNIMGLCWMSDTWFSDGDSILCKIASFASQIKIRKVIQTYRAMTTLCQMRDDGKCRPWGTAEVFLWSRPGGGDLSGPDDAQSESQRVWRSHSRDGKKVPDEGNHITYSETAGAIKTLAAPPKL